MPKAKRSSKPNPSQEKAIKHTSGPLLVVAGAGTGKTRVITERIKHLINTQGIKPAEILALTFTDKASQEMVERVEDVMPLGYEEPWVYTFHSFADRLLKAEGMEIGLDPTYKIMSDSDRWLLLRKNFFKLDLKYYRPLGNPTKFISAILKFISRLQDEYISSENLAAFVEKLQTETLEEKQKWEELAYIYKEYERLKIENSKLDFGDLIDWTIRLFSTRPNILKKYQTQFKHVMVDEFQDTNYAQYELIKLLCPKKMDKRSLVVVGDDSQSIYKFRGAAVSNILQFMEDYGGADMITLLENYRSSQKILDPAYALVQNNNPDTLEAKLGISKKLTSVVDKKGTAPAVALTETAEDEVELVVAKIYEILGKEPEYTYKDFAILARANNHLDPFLLALRKHGIPYQLVGNRGLYDREEVRDVIAFLKVLLNPKDAVSLYRVLNFPSLEIPYEEISKMLTQAKLQRVDLWETLEKSTNDACKAAITLLTEFQKHVAKQTPSELTYNLVNSAKYLDIFLAEETIENALAIKNLDLLLNRIKRFEIDYHSDTGEIPTVVEFVDYLELVLEAGENPAQAEIEDIDTVNLMTIHASKGLEFPVVFLVNVVEGRFPTRERSDAIEIPDELIKETLPTGDAHLQEERRLFYVAMTRAKKYLFVTLAKNYGGKRDKHPSGFLAETGLPVTETPVDRDKEAQTSLFGIDSPYRKIPATKIRELLPSFLSYSQIDTFNTCPLQYKYKYLLKIPSLPNHALTFGDTLHNTLRDFHTKRMFGDVSLNQLLNLYKTHWQPLGYLDENHRKLRFENGIKLLERYYEANKNEKAKHLALEKGFNIKIEGVKFYGRIDRIDELPEGGVEIIDYKTGNAKDQKEVDKDDQVAFYAIGAKEALGLEPKKLTLYFVESGNRVTTTRTEEQLKQKKDEVVEVVKEIKKGDFEATPGMHCTWCDFKNICPFAFKG